MVVVIGRREYTADAIGGEDLDRGINPVTLTRQIYVHYREIRALGTGKPHCLRGRSRNPDDLEPRVGKAILEVDPHNIIILDDQDARNLARGSAR
jgi:hypothetical protein